MLGKKHFQACLENNVLLVFDPEEDDEFEGALGLVDGNSTDEDPEMEDSE